MATTGGSRAPLAAALAAALVAGCAAPSVPGGPAPPGPVAGEPTVQVGLVIGGSSVTLGGEGPLRLEQADGSPVLEIPGGEAWTAAAAPGGIGLMSASGAHAGLVDRVRVAPADSADAVRVNGRAYRGTLLLFRDRTGLTLVNQVALEAYLRGVLSLEMGRRDPAEREALRAQAVVSRTYALRNLGRWRAQGFDLYATVADQVYGGVGGETPEAKEAVASTRGQILTYGGEPIDAFFFSTCGGRTAEGTEVFRGADRPYLRSVPDVSPDGVVYCSISPRFRWREEWSGEGLRSVLRRWLPAVLGVAPGRIQAVRDVRIEQLTPSGRVGRIRLVLGERDAVDVDGPLIRQVLRNGAGDLLRSTAFTLQVTRNGGRLDRLVIEGSGNGHGVGFCQWGAVGRARAGQEYRQILQAYYPGAEVTALY